MNYHVQKFGVSKAYFILLYSVSHDPSKIMLYADQETFLIIHVGNSCAV